MKPETIVAPISRKYSAVTKILVPTDFSENAENAVRYALKVAAKAKATVLLLHTYQAPVVADAQMPGNMMYELIEEEEKISNNRLRELIDNIHNRKEFSQIHLKPVSSMGFLAEEAASVAADKNVDLIVMGTKGASGLKELMLGSNTAKVIEKSRVPVLAIPSQAKFVKIEKIVYATDFRSNDFPILQRLADFAKIFKAHIAVLHVSPPGEGDIDEKLDRLFTEVKYKLNYEKISFHILSKEKIIEGIDDFIKSSKADILAMATHERSLFGSLFHKSITKKMAYHTHIPLLTFHKKD